MNNVDQTINQRRLIKDPNESPINSTEIIAQNLNLEISNSTLSVTPSSNMNEPSSLKPSMIEITQLPDLDLETIIFNKTEKEEEQNESNTTYSQEKKLFENDAANMGQTTHYKEENQNIMCESKSLINGKHQNTHYNNDFRKNLKQVTLADVDSQEKNISEISSAKDLKINSIQFFVDDKNTIKMINPHVKPDHTAVFFEENGSCKIISQGDLANIQKEPESILKNKFDRRDSDLDYYTREENNEKFWCIQNNMKLFIQYLKFAICFTNPKIWFPQFKSSKTIIMKFFQLNFSILMSLIILSNVISFFISGISLDYKVLSLILSGQLTTFLIASLGWTKDTHEGEAKHFEKIIFHHNTVSKKVSIINEETGDYSQLKVKKLVNCVLGINETNYKSKLKPLDIIIIVLSLVGLKYYMILYNDCGIKINDIPLTIFSFMIPMNFAHTIHQISVIGFYVVSAYLIAILVTSNDIKSKCAKYEFLKNLLYPVIQSHLSPMRINICCEQTLKYWKRMYTLVDKANSYQAWSERFLFTFYLAYLTIFTIAKIIKAYDYGKFRFEIITALDYYLAYHYKIDILTFTIPIIFRIRYCYKLTQSFMVLKGVIDNILSDVTSLLNEDLAVIKLKEQQIHYKGYLYLVKCLKGPTIINSGIILFIINIIIN